MSDTLVIQSHRTPLPFGWLEPCLHSVRDWSELNSYHYRFIGDELFDVIPAALLEARKETHGNEKVIASDLARLRVLQAALAEGYQTVVWLDADFLIISPSQMVLPKTPYAVGREVWVQENREGKLKVYKKVHNALLMFRQGNSFLDFYAETAQRLLEQNTGNIPPQFIGPKLLTALHNIARLPVMESAGMLSPMVIKDLLAGSGRALSQFRDHSPMPIAGANLCTSSCNRQEVSSAEMAKLIELLGTESGIFLP